MMKRIALLFLLLTILSGITLPSFAQLNEQAAKDLIARIIPKQANHFEVAYIPEEGGKDVFEIESHNGKIILKGNNGVSVASALNYYLRNYCHCLITWNGINLKLPDPLPLVEKKIHNTSPYQNRYYLNYVTFNYTMTWWDWDRWQKEIDWMALNGINMPLAITGETAIWQRVYKKMGFTNKELDAFFPGPAYLAWFWMSNLDAWDGPLPQHWIDTHEALQKKILSRERSLGMKPVLPSFAGHVPPDFTKKFPDAKVNQVIWNGHFPAVNILSPEDSLFTNIGKWFLEEQTEAYGTDHYYSADIFNEMVPPSDDSLYLNDISQKVYQSMHIVDTAAVWVMQAWLFYSNAKFWHPTQIQALLNAVPNNKMLILDLWSERKPFWDKTEAYYGKPWIWNMLHNFGGRIYLGGCMPCVTQEPANLLNNPKAGKLVGLGLTMEGAEQNPANYQLMLDNIWRAKPINIDHWIENYIHQRYGSLNNNALKAWQLLASSVYANNPNPKGFKGPVSVVTARPSFSKVDKSKDARDIFYYDPTDLLKAWKLLLNASSDLRSNDGFQFDLVDVGREVLADYAVLLEHQISNAYEDKDIATFQNLSHQYLSLIDDMDKLVGTRKDFLLSKWINDARNLGITQQEKNLYEFNARHLITSWGREGDKSLPDYARKQWNGLLKDFYKPRWKMFFSYADSCLKNQVPLDMDVFNQRIIPWETQWIHSHTTYQEASTDDPVKISMKMYSKYNQRIEKAFEE